MPLSYCVGQPSEFTGPVRMWGCMLPGNTYLEMCAGKCAAWHCVLDTFFVPASLMKQQHISNVFDENNSSAIVVIKCIAGVLLLTE